MRIAKRRSRSRFSELSRLLQEVSVQPIRLQIAPVLVAALIVFLIFDLLPHPALRRGMVLSAISRVQIALRSFSS